MTGRYATPLQVRMSEAEREALVSAAREQRVPVSVLVREALEREIARYKAATRREAKARRAAVKAEAETQEVER